MNKCWILGLAAMLFLASCQSSAPLRQFTTGEVQASYDFSDAGAFEVGAYGAATLQVVAGTYEIDVLQGDNAIWWAQGGGNYTDSVIDVDANQLSERNENAYGVMCRVRGSVGLPESVDPTLSVLMQDSTAEATVQALSTGEPTESATSEAAASAAATAEATAEASAEASAEAPTLEVLPTTAVTATALLTPTPEPTRALISEGDGYLFLIQGGGQFAIMRSRGRNLTPLVDWKASSAIKQGPAQNHIRAICAGNYLALYVNDQFLGDATDDTYTSGQVALAASAATRLGTRIAFDNLSIAAATLK